jgi:TolB-like protein/Tfp pilus assembly protein PilF
VPGKLDSILSRCLGRDRQDRYQEIGELITDLQPPRGTHGPARTRGVAKRRMWLILVPAFVLIVYTGLWIRHARAPQFAPSGYRAAAVLPFRNTSHDPNQQYLADGMTDELIATLSKITALRVIPHTSVMRYKNNRKPVAEVARELSVDMIVDGSVMRVGDHVRVSARLIHAVSNETRWTKTYDRPLEGLPSLQSDVARAIVSAAGVALTPGEGSRLKNGTLVNPKAYDLFLRGQHALYQPGEAALREAIVNFKEAALYDPGLSLAHVGIAEAWFWLSSWYVRPHDAMPHAKAAALRALEIEPELADAHAALGNVALFYDWDWSAAERHFLKAIRLNPNSAAAHRGYSDCLLAQRRFDEAIEQGKRGVELDPFSLAMRTDYLLALATAGRNDEAIREAQRAIDVEPEFSLAFAIRGLARSAKKLHGEAVRDLEQAVAVERTPTNLGFLAYVQAAAGQRPAALRVLQELRRTAATRYVCPFEIGIAYSGFGDRDEAFRWMEKAMVDRADCMVMLAAEPWAEGIRKDHRFHDLLRRVGLQTVAAR